MSRTSRVSIRLLLIAWASPNSMIGLFFGVLALFTGGGCQVRRGCIEFYGGLVKRLLRLMMEGDGVAAMTLGHIILGQTKKTLDVSRDHEQVHVRQYERWGPLFLWAYFGSSTILWFSGRDAYLDNPFEVEAYRIAPLESSASNPQSDDQKPPG